MPPTYILTVYICKHYTSFCFALVFLVLFLYLRLRGLTFHFVSGDELVYFHFREYYHITVKDVIRGIAHCYCA